MEQPSGVAERQTWLRLALPSTGDDLRTIRIPGEGALLADLLRRGGLARYEPESLACFLACLDRAEPGAVFDVGANIGIYAWLAAARPGRVVQAFEPAPPIAELLTEIAESNHLAIDVRRVALADATGEADFHVSARSDCSSSLDPGFREATEVLRVQLDTIDRLVAAGAPSPAMIKIDTETTEPAVLRGARRTLASTRPWILCEVLAGHSEAELEEVLAPLGYSWYQITHENPLIPRREIFGDRSGRYTNWLFAPEPAGAEFWQSMAAWKEAVGRCTPVEQRWPVDVSAWAFGDDAAGFAARWAPLDWPQLTVRWRDGALDVRSEQPDGARVHVYHGGVPFEEAGPPGTGVSVVAGCEYEVELEVGTENVVPSAHALIMQYSATGKLDAGRVYLRAGINRHRFETFEDTTSLRIAFRIAGTGHMKVLPARLYEIGSQA